MHATKNGCAGFRLVLVTFCDVGVVWSQSEVEGFGDECPFGSVWREAAVTVEPQLVALVQESSAFFVEALECDSFVVGACFWS